MTRRLSDSPPRLGRRKRVLQVRLKLRKSTILRLIKKGRRAAISPCRRLASFAIPKLLPKPTRLSFTPASANTLEDFSIMAQVVGWVAGPTITLFKVDLPSGVRVSRIMSLTDDIALALAAPGVRIFAPIPGTNHVGIKVPYRTRQNVLLGDVLKDAHGAPLEMAIGKDVEGHSIVVDLAKIPHAYRRHRRFGQVSRN